MNTTSTSKSIIYPSRSQVEAYYFGSPKSIGEKILFIKREKRLFEYKKYLTDTFEFGNVWHGLTGLLHGDKVSIIATGIGPSLVGDAIYALDRPNAICLYSGTCGGLDQNLKIGDYFIANKAICGDGYTLNFGYTPMSVVVGDTDILQALGSSIDSKVQRWNKGVTFTTSSVVRENDSNFWNSVDEHCPIIEMAAAAFYAAALATDKNAAAYFWVSDLPIGGKSFFDPLSPEDKQIKQERYDNTVLLDIALLSSLRR